MHYNKKVKSKEFSKGDLVWKVKLPISSKDTYILEMLEGEEEFDKAINGKFLKKYYPSI
jgi:hypothetical protein